MRSRIESHARAAIAFTLLCVCGPASAAPHDPAASAATPGRAEIARAIETVKADPNLATERTIKTLRWKASTPRGSTRLPGWLSWLGDLLSWIGGLFAWLGESIRVLVWCAAAALAGWLVVYLSRLARTRLAASDLDTFVAPTHVRDLDIRPETLPDDVGAAARQLWERGEERAALALLYRGMLSRLAHVHRVPIRDSSTEGDCLTLAARTLDAARLEYTTRLVRTWQRATYGGLSIDTAVIHELCAQFDVHLAQPQATEQQPSGFASGAAA